MSSVTFESVSRIYDTTTTPAVDALDLHVEDGEFLVVVGPSGCGKSTTLRMLAGLEPVNSGRILIGDADVTRSRARDRDVAMVFQSYALYPNMTASENMAFALRNTKVPKTQIRERVAQAARILQLEDLLDRKPAKMSGGQRQRVAMGRAIVREPAVFCMDEPLSNLDAKLRVSTRGEIAELQRRLGTTTVYVTHDQTEAMTMGHRVCVLDAGRLQQVGTPTDLYERPVNTFVASFLGSPTINLFHQVPVREGRAHLTATCGIPLERGAAADSAFVSIGIRSEGFSLADSSESGEVLEATVARVEHMGSEILAFVDIDEIAGSGLAASEVPQDGSEPEISADRPAVAEPANRAETGSDSPAPDPTGRGSGADSPVTPESSGDTVGVTLGGAHVSVTLDKRRQLQVGDRLLLRPHLEEVLVFDQDGQAVSRPS